MINFIFRGLLFVGLLFGLSACIVAKREIIDSGPSLPVDVSQIPDAQPRYEPRTRAGNSSPYTVLGKTYRVLGDASGYRESGIASWYGRKFHGRKTANGETYDMYAMTAAHKSLPIPSYVRVTNLSNGREVVVRVNDRGPFHDDRIIDLSYTAAKKLGFHDSGTAEVSVTAIEVASPVDLVVIKEPVQSDVATVNEQLANAYLQAGAFGSASGAIALENKLLAYTQYPVQVYLQGSLYKVRIGPIADQLELLTLSERIRNARVAEPYVVYD